MREINASDDVFTVANVNDMHLPHAQYVATRSKLNVAVNAVER